jgi:serine/threonine protein kinase
MTTDVHKLSFYEAIRLVNTIGTEKAGKDLGKHVTNFINPSYDFRKFLGQGGESIVWAVWHPKRKQTIAIKCALPYINYVENGEDNKPQERFFRSIELQRELAGLINKKGIGKIPQVLSFPRRNYRESHDPKYIDPIYIEMEYVSGLGIVEYCRQLTMPSKLKIYSRLLILVQEVHSWGIIHSDLKSYNWMIEDELPALLDFGLAKGIEDDDKPEITVERTKLGSKYYSSPEQLVDARIRDYSADIYTMGMVLWDVLTGAYPNDDRQGIETFGKEVFSIYQKATHPRKHKRYQTARELRKAVDILLKRPENIKTQEILREKIELTRELESVKRPNVVRAWYEALMLFEAKTIKIERRDAE